MRGLRNGLVGHALSLLLALIFACSTTVLSPMEAVARRHTRARPGVELSERGTPTVVREETDRRTEYSKHYLYSDGSRRAEISASPVHFKNERGSWKEIDPTFVPGTGLAEYRTAGTSARVSMASQARGRRPVRVEKDGWSVELDMLGVAENAKLVYGNRARYMSVAKDTDLVYETTGDDLKETLVLSSADAPNRFTFLMAFENLELRSLFGGGYALFEPGQSEPTVLVGDLIVFDDSENAEGEPAYCPESTMTVVPTDGGAFITYEFSRAWLEDSERAFPVFVDPTLSLAPSQDAYTQSSKYGYNSSFLKTLDQRTDRWTWLRWPVLSSIPRGAYVTSSKAQLYLYANYGSGTERMYHAASNWYESSITWKNQPPRGAGIQSQNVYGVRRWIDWNLTSATQQWVDSRVNYGVVIKGSSAGSHNYYSSEYWNGSYRPKLIVNYRDYTGTATSASSSPAQVSVGSDDIITATLAVATPYPSEVRDVRMLPNYAGGSGGSRYGGYFGWFRDSVPAGFSSIAAPGGGRWGWYSPTSSSYGANKIDFLEQECTVSQTSSGKTFTFKWRLLDNYGDVQDNTLDHLVYMGPSTTNRWNTGWRTTSSHFDVLPEPVSNVQAAVQGSEWYRETDRDDDGRADGFNDSEGMGRGMVDLTWPAASLADGYRVYLYDGGEYRQVGEARGNDNTSWTSEGRGIYPPDSEIDAWGTEYSGDPFYRRDPMTSATREAILERGDLGNTGLVVSDGSFLYVREYGSAKANRWTRLGSGYAGTATGTVLGKIGPDLYGKRAYSAFYMDGFLFSGYATSATTIEGVAKGASSDSGAVRTLTFSEPLLDRTDATALRGASSDVMLTADGDYIYCVATKRSGEEYQVRVFERDGTFVADHTLPGMSKKTPRSVLSDGVRLYITDTDDRTWTVRLSDWSILRQSEIENYKDDVGAGSYDFVNKVFWVGRTGTDKDDDEAVFRYAGPGLDLRDSANALYRATDGGTHDDFTNYEFRVVPYSEQGSLSVLGNEAVSPILPNRTVRVTDDSRHTTYDLGELLHHQATAVLDEGELELAVTDLDIATWGPYSALDRTYSSDTTASTMFAPGWRFGFEQHLEFDGDDVTYVDSSGDEHRFDYEEGYARGDTDFDMTVKVDSLDDTDPWAKAGLMLRTGAIEGDAVDGDAAMAVMVVTPSRGVRFQWREKEGGTCQSAGPAGVTAPVWLRMTREGDTVSGYYSTTGADWTHAGSTDGIELEANVRLGIGHTTHADGVSGDADLSEITVDGEAFDERMMSVSWIGSSSFAGYPAVSGDEVTMRSEGADFWGTTDEGSFYHTAEGGWAAPNGYYGKLESSDADRYSLTFKDRSVLTFDATGALLSETDKNGNRTDYDRSQQGEIRIGAANGQSIVVSLNSSGTVSTATYATEDGTRSVGYDIDGDIATVTYFEDTADEYSVVYAYGDSGVQDARMVELSVPGLEWSGPSEEASWAFGYGTRGRFDSWQLTSGGVGPTGKEAILYEPSDSQATVIRHGDVDGVHNASIAQAYSWNPTGTLAKRTVPGSPEPSDDTWSYEYGSANECIREVSPVGRPVSRAFDVRGNNIYEYDQDGDRVESAYDRRDQLIRQTDQLGATTYYSYDATGNLIADERVLDSAGDRSRTEYTYDQRGRLTSERSKITADEWARTDYFDFAKSGEARTAIARDVKLAPEASPVDLVTSKQFDSFGNLEWEKDATGRWTTKENTYSVSGRLLASEAVTGTVTHYRYNTLGDTWETSTTAGGDFADWTLEVHDARGALMRTMRYDDTGTMREGETYVRDARGAVREYIDRSRSPEGFKYHYDAAGNQIRVWAPGTIFGDDSQATRVTYDAEGREIQRIEPGDGAGDSTDTTYSLDGNVTRVDSPDGTWVEFGYDAVGNQVSQTVPSEDGEVTVWSKYDLGGRLVSTTDADGNTTTFSYDLGGRQVAAGIEGAGGSTAAYNSVGWDIERADCDGIVAKTAYDSAGRLLETEIAGEHASVAYDAAGRVSSRTEPDGRTVNYSHDAFGRMIREWHTVAGDGAPVKDARSVYNAFSQVTEVSEAIGSVDHSLSYDLQGKLMSSSASYAEATSAVTYDVTKGAESSRRVDTSVTVATRSVTSRDLKDLPTSVLVAGVGTQSFTYDAAGHTLTQAGYGTAGPGISYTYGDAGLKVSESLSLAYPGASWTSRYSYTNGGKLAVSEIDGKESIFTYDESGNLIAYRRSGEDTVTLTYDEGNRLISAGPTDFGWDMGHGWRTSAKRNDGPSVTYGYTDSGRLERYVDPDGSVEAAYAYDADGQRTTSVVTSGSVTTTTTYTYEGVTLLALCAEASDGTTSSLTYFYDEASRPWAAIFASSQTSEPVLFYLLTTDRGDVVELLDDSGDAFAMYTYDAWGNPTESASSSTDTLDAMTAKEICAAQVLRYAGYVYDEHSGMYYCSQRYYDPAAYSFITKDPARADGEQSAYQYCGGDPVGAKDPTGAWSANYWHKPKTYSIARSLGLNVTYRYWLRWGAWLADYNISTNPVTGTYIHFNLSRYRPYSLARSEYAVSFPYVWGRDDSRLSFASRAGREARYLFARSLRARRVDAYYLRRNAAKWLGLGMHAIQDTYAHGSMHPLYHTKNLDNPNWRSPWERRMGYSRGWRARSAISKSRSYLRSFRYLSLMKTSPNVLR